MKSKQLAEEIKVLIGGEDNISSVTHCVTRLRVVPIDRSLVDTEQISKLAGVIQVVEAGGQIQIVIGTTVPEVYKYFVGEEKPQKTNGESELKKSEKIFNFFAGVFTPTVPVLAAGGLLRGILTILVSAGLMDSQGGTYMVLYAIADVVIYFFPLFLAITTAKYFKLNEYTALALGGVLLYPTLIDAFTNGTDISFLGIHVTLVQYASSVVPIIAAVYFMAVLDKNLRKVVPSIVAAFIVPLLDLLIMVPLTLIIVGPILTILTNMFTTSFLYVYGISPLLFGFIYGLFWQPLVVLGLHRGFIPVTLTNFSTLGYDPLIAVTMPSVFAQTAASIGIGLKTKNKDFRGVALSNAIPGFLGVTEPIVYGVTLKSKQPFYIACLMSGISGAIISVAGVYAIGMPAGGILATPVFAESGLFWYIIACLIAFIGTLILTLLFNFIDMDEDEIMEEE